MIYQCETTKYFISLLVNDTSLLSCKVLAHKRYSAKKKLFVNYFEKGEFDQSVKYYKKEKVDILCFKKGLSRFWCNEKNCMQHGYNPSTALTQRT